MNMIDDSKQVVALMELMERHFPIPVQVTTQLAHTLRKSGITVPSDRTMQIDEITYFGDEGGIVCHLTAGRLKKPVVVSITHVRLPKSHPIESEVRAYQIARTKKLAEQEL